MEESVFLALCNDDKILTIDLHESESVVDALEQLEKELFFIFKKDVESADEIPTKVGKKDLFFVFKIFG